MKQYKVTITLILDAEDENEALDGAKSYLALGVIPEDISIREVKE